MAKKRKPTDYVQFKLRIRESLRQQIEREAKKRDQSTNQEAVERLEKSFQPKPFDVFALLMSAFETGEQRDWDRQRLLDELSARLALILSQVWAEIESVELTLYPENANREGYSSRSETFPGVFDNADLAKVIEWRVKRLETEDKGDKS